MTNDTAGTFEKLQNARAQILEILKAEGFKMRVDDFDEIYIISRVRTLEDGREMYCRLRLRE